MLKLQSHGFRQTQDIKLDIMSVDDGRGQQRTHAGLTAVYPIVHLMHIFIITMTLPEQLIFMHVLLRLPLLHIPSRGLSVTVPSPRQYPHQLSDQPSESWGFSQLFSADFCCFQSFFCSTQLKTKAYVTTSGGSIAHQPTTCCLFITSRFTPVALP